MVFALARDSKNRKSKKSQLSVSISLNVRSSFTILWLLWVWALSIYAFCFEGTSPLNGTLGTAGSALSLLGHGPWASLFLFMDDVQDFEVIVKGLVEFSFSDIVVPYWLALFFIQTQLDLSPFGRIGCNAFAGSILDVAWAQEDHSNIVHVC